MEIRKLCDPALRSHCQTFWSIVEVSYVERNLRVWYLLEVCCDPKSFRRLPSIYFNPL